MTSTRTLATLIVRDNATNDPEAILLIIPLAINQIDLLNMNVNAFCLQRNMTLVIPAQFQNWLSTTGVNEFQCEACNRTCLQQTLDLEQLTITERFCSDFCRRAVNTESQQE